MSASASRPWVAIADYGMGNLYSVLHACKSTGIDAEVTADPQRVLDAAGVILPGVGAFGDAMREIELRGLLAPLQRAARSGKPFVGICLGMQLMMDESFEFGHHTGLGLIAGKVVRFDDPRGDDGEPLKVPEVGWNAIVAPSEVPASFEGTLLDGVPNGAAMYFVHSYYCEPAQRTDVVSLSHYGQVDYCSTVARGNVFGCQFHPERSGEAGLHIYRNLGRLLAHE